MLGCYFFGVLPEIKILWHFEIFGDAGPYGLEISKGYSYSFHLISSKLYEDSGYNGGIQSITFLGNWPSLKHFVVFWNFNMGVNGKIVKYSNNLKMDDH